MFFAQKNISYYNERPLVTNDVKCTCKWAIGSVFFHYIKFCLSYKATNINIKHTTTLFNVK